MNSFELVFPDHSIIWKALARQLPPRTMGETDEYIEYYNQLTNIQCELIAPALEGCNHITDLGGGVGRFGVGFYKAGICNKLTLADFDEP